LQNGQNEKALDDVKLTLRLADSVRNETFLISHLVRIAVVTIALQPVWEGMAEHQWSDAQLTELDSQLAKLDFLADYKLTMRGEMVFQGGIIDYLQRHPEQFPNMSGDGNVVKRSLAARIRWHLIPSGWFYQSRLRCARPMVELYIPLSDTNRGIISPTATLHADAAVQDETKHPNRYNAIEKMLLPALGNAAKRFAYGQESVDLARVAIALERFRLVQANIPDRSTRLSPGSSKKCRRTSSTVSHCTIAAPLTENSCSIPLAGMKRTTTGRWSCKKMGCLTTRKAIGSGKIKSDSPPNGLRTQRRFRRKRAGASLHSFS
jgi:hypothetical protein